MGSLQSTEPVDRYTFFLGMPACLLNPCEDSGNIIITILLRGLYQPSVPTVNQCLAGPKVHWQDPRYTNGKVDGILLMYRFRWAR